MIRGFLCVLLVGVFAFLAPIGAFGADHTPADEAKLGAFAGFYGRLIGYTSLCEGLERSRSIKGWAALKAETVESLWGATHAQSFWTSVKAAAPIWRLHYRDHGCQAFDLDAVYAEYQKLAAWWLSRLKAELGLDSEI